MAHFDERVETLQGLTSSRDELAAALDRLRIPSHFATLIYSAVRQSSEDLMRRESGRKAFILLTDGVAFRDDTSIGTAIEYAQRADTIIYSIRYSDHIKVYRPVRAAVLATASERGKEGLQRMGQETGGALYQVSKNEPIEAIYSMIEDALRNQYSIGYAPAVSHTSGTYHKIRIRLKDPNLVVQTRDGYYAK